MDQCPVDGSARPAASPRLLSCSPFVLESLVEQRQDEETHAGGHHAAGAGHVPRVKQHKLVHAEMECHLPPEVAVRSGQIRLTGGGHEKDGGTEASMTLFSYLLHQCSEVPLLAMDKRAIKEMLSGAAESSFNFLQS